VDMLKVNNDRDVATKDRHAILLNEYLKENKYQTRIKKMFYSDIYALQENILSLKSVPKKKTPVAKCGF
jgi:hypothetical protein